LPTNFTENSEALLRKNRSCTVFASATPPTNEPVAPAPSATTTMAQKLLRKYSIPAVANMPVGPAVTTGNRNFELRPELIMIVQANSFYGFPSEDANAHLQHFLELCNTIFIKNVAPNIIRLHLFSFSLVGKAKQWFYKDKQAVST